MLFDAGPDCTPATLLDGIPGGTNSAVSRPPLQVRPLSFGLDARARDESMELSPSAPAITTVRRNQRFVSGILPSSLLEESGSSWGEIKLALEALV